MGNCTTKMTIAPDVILTLKAHPDINHLLALQLHYDSYDSASKKEIDVCTQLALTHNLQLELSAQVSDGDAGGPYASKDARALETKHEQQ
jgi:hypothetical protein